MNLQQGYLQVYQKTGRKYHTLQTTLSKPNERIGNLEHLHLHCKSSTLVNTRIYCYHKIERAPIISITLPQLEKLGYHFIKILE